MMAAIERQALTACYRDGLLNDVLPFWLSHGVDQTYGGILTCLDQDGTVLDTDKSVWHQGRFTWLLGELYNNVEPRPEWLALGERNLAFIDQHCIDPSDRRMWFQVTQEGRPIRKRRYAFSESFAAIAYGEMALATGNASYATRAVELFQQFVRHNLDPPPQTAKFTTERPLRSIGFPMIMLATAQELRGSVGMADADHWIDRGIEEIVGYFLKPDLRCVLETVGPRGELVPHFDGRTLNPGHAIEAAWFLLREGRWRNDQHLIQTGCQMLDWMWERGWDTQHGGLRYFVSIDSRPIQEYWHEMKFWWPHNEAVIASLMAFLLTDDPKYADMHNQVHGWSHAHFGDPVHGEWFGYLNRDGSLSSSLKGNLWKGPFHLPRMQLTCWQLLRDA
ncbi:AGE family epimerase/isomerase [Planctomycetaceae bacterium SH139]